MLQSGPSDASQVLLDKEISVRVSTDFFSAIAETLKLPTKVT